MADSAISGASKEAAFQAFEAEFVRNGFQVPDGLIRLLRAFALKPGETPDQARHRLYRRLWALLWVYKVNIGDLAKAKWPSAKKEKKRN